MDQKGGKKKKNLQIKMKETVCKNSRRLAYRYIHVSIVKGPKQMFIKLFAENKCVTALLKI